MLDGRACSATTAAKSCAGALADHAIVVDCDDIPRIQETQAAIYHVVARALDWLRMRCSNCSRRARVRTALRCASTWSGTAGVRGVRRRGGRRGADAAARAVRPHRWCPVLVEDGRVLQVGWRGPRLRRRRRMTALRAGGHGRVGITGVVQGVGFRPFVYRLATEHGVAAGSSMAKTACASIAEGDATMRSTRFVDARRARSRRPRPRSHPSTSRRSRSAGFERFEIRESRSDGRRPCASRPTCRSATSAARAVRSGRSPLRISVHQLHELRAALQHRASACRTTGSRTTMRDWPLCADCRREYRRSGRPPLPRTAGRVPGVRPALSSALRAS